MRGLIKRIALSGGVLGALLGSSALTTPVMADAPPSLPEAVLNAPDGQEFPVIITLSHQADLMSLKGKRGRQSRVRVIEVLHEAADQTQPPIIGFLRQTGARGIRPLWIINGIAATMNGAALRALAEQPGIGSIRIDETLEAPVTTFATAAPPEWNISKINAPALWDLGISGQGVVIANMDTGVDANHPDLNLNWRGGTNSWFDPNGEHSLPYDADGHGTQTMGLMVGGDAGGTSVGVAPQASWIAVKIFNDAGEAAMSRIHEGFQWLLDPDGNPETDDAPDVVSNSWGFTSADGCVLEFQPDIDALKMANIAVVFSAGNEGPGSASDVSPANNPSAFAAGVVDQDSVVGNFSSRGPSTCDGTVFPEVVAPGISVETADLSFGGYGFYANVSGTSFAVPHVAAGMALLRGALPDVAVRELETALRVSAMDLGETGPDNDSGYGLINLAAAYQQLQALPVTDKDGDGFAADVDCNDDDAMIHPGALEIKHDSIDQDCNGYDLTIDLTKASYDTRKDRLNVEAVSTLGAAAGLELSGYGPMDWNARKEKWSLTVGSVGGDPGVVEVTGVEGTETSATSSGGGSGGKKTPGPKGKKTT